MSDENIRESVNLLAERIDNIDAISSHALLRSEQPNRLVALLHNRLGNIQHMINDSASAFNATDQFLELTAAVRECSGLGEILLDLHAIELITDVQYEYIARDAHELTDKLKRLIDPQYTE